MQDKVTIPGLADLIHNCHGSPVNVSWIAATRDLANVRDSESMIESS
jgi:hypothetical protein